MTFKATNDTTSDKYRRIELIFDAVARDAGSKKDDIFVVRKMLSALDIRGKTVLEAGCGMGDNLLHCAKEGAAYAEGFDISAENIKVASGKARGIQNIFFHKCNIEDYTTGRVFDIVMCIGVFEYFNDPVASLKKMCSLLKKDGSIVILISKPTLLKKISFLFRAPLSVIPIFMTMKVTGMINAALLKFDKVFKKSLSTASSGTYTIKRIILEGLMVDRYNVSNYSRFREYFKKEGFIANEFKDLSPSMVGVIASRPASGEDGKA